MNRGDPLRVRDYLEHIAEAIANIDVHSAGMHRGGACEGKPCLFTW